MPLRPRTHAQLAVRYVPNQSLSGGLSPDQLRHGRAQVDTHIHHSACMHQKHLLRFIKSKLRKEPDEVVIFRDGKYLTLREVFESLQMTGRVLTCKLWRCMVLFELGDMLDLPSACAALRGRGACPYSTCPTSVMDFCVAARRLPAIVAYHWETAAHQQTARMPVDYSPNPPQRAAPPPVGPKQRRLDF